MTHLKNKTLFCKLSPLVNPLAVPPCQVRWAAPLPTRVASYGDESMCPTPTLLQHRTYLRQLSHDGPKSERRSNSGPSSQASDHGGRDVTDFKGWEIEYLASKVYGYLQRKLDIERERHGQRRI